MNDRGREGTTFSFLMLMAPMAPSQGWDKGETNEANTSDAKHSVRKIIFYEIFKKTK